MEKTKTQTDISPETPLADAPVSTPTVGPSKDSAFQKRKLKVAREMEKKDPIDCALDSAYAGTVPSYEWMDDVVMTSSDVAASAVNTVLSAVRDSKDARSADLPEGLKKDVDILTKIRYQPLSVLSLKDEFFATIEGFAQSFAKELGDIQVAMETDLKNTNPTLDQEVGNSDPIKAEYTRQDYVLSLDKKLYFMNVFRLKNELYSDYLARIALDCQSISHPAYFELYFRLQSPYIKRATPFRKLDKILARMETPENAPVVSDLKRRLYLSVHFQNGKMLKQVLFTALESAPNETIRKEFFQAMNQLLWLSRNEIFESFQNNHEAFIHFHKICNDVFFDPDTKEWLSSEERTMVETGVVDRSKLVARRAEIRNHADYLVTLDNPRMERITDPAHRNYADWIRVAKYFDERNAGVTSFQEFREVINSVLSHPLGSFLYPYFLYTVKSALKLSHRHFQILRDTVIFTAKSERDWAYVVTFFAHLESLLYKKPGILFHIARWSSVSVVSILAVATFVGVFRFPLFFGVMVIAYGFLSICTKFLHAYAWTGVNTLLKYAIIGLFVLNGGLDTMELKTRFDQFVVDTKNVDMDKTFANALSYPLQWVRGENGKASLIEWKATKKTESYAPAKAMSGALSNIPAVSPKIQPTTGSGSK